MAAVTGANEISGAVIASTFTIMVVFLPLFLIRGLAGQMFTQFALVVIFSMATSFTKAALGAEGMASAARMLVGSGYAPDRGAYALELLSRDHRLERALAGG